MVERTILHFIKGDNSFNISEYNSLFDKIQKSKITDDLVKIANDYNINLENTKYPRLEIDISESEIKELIDTGIITLNKDDDLLSFNQDELSPIAKLLFALAWKKGDLQKLKLIIQGIKDVKKPKEDIEKGVVFYCFGNHLGNKTKYPIIDQHVIRAFNLKNNSNYDSVRKSNNVNQSDRQNYLKWIWEFENDNADFLYYLDRILFEIGKAVKLQ